MNPLHNLIVNNPSATSIITPNFRTITATYFYFCGRTVPVIDTSSIEVNACAINLLNKSTHSYHNPSAIIITLSLSHTPTSVS